MVAAPFHICVLLYIEACVLLSFYDQILRIIDYLPRLYVSDALSIENEEISSFSIRIMEHLLRSMSSFQHYRSFKSKNRQKSVILAKFS